MSTESSGLKKNTVRAKYFGPALSIRLGWYGTVLLTLIFLSGQIFVNCFFVYSGEDTESLPFYTQRSLMMVNIIRKMRREIEDTTRSPGTRIIGQCCRSRPFLAGAGVNLFNVDCVPSLIKLLRQRGKQIWADCRSRRDFKNSKPTIKMTGSVSPVVKDVFT